MLLLLPNVRPCLISAYTNISNEAGLSWRDTTDDTSARAISCRICPNLNLIKVCVSIIQTIEDRRSLLQQLARKADNNVGTWELSAEKALTRTRPIESTCPIFILAHSHRCIKTERNLNHLKDKISGPYWSGCARNRSAVAAPCLIPQRASIIFCCTLGTPHFSPNNNTSLPRRPAPKAKKILPTL